ncbi:MAG: helix-turn-helix domain-containing protein [Rhodospirillaceae bacterium]|nr:helix-turn-helix domain-containing protein [Rhodospirillaceae bacterium]
MPLWDAIPAKRAPAVIEVTVLLLDGGYASTAVGAIEVFQSAGVLWESLRGEPAVPRFNVTTASVDGRATRPVSPLSIAPRCAIAEVRRADLIFVPAMAVDTDAMLRRHAAAIPWLRRWHRSGTRIAGVCAGVPLLAEAGLLDGRSATTHWALVDAYRRRYPGVRWQPEYFITEANGVFCGGGVNAALDLSLYLVERLCGREVAVRCAKALLIDMPRPSQAGFADLPLQMHHHDEAIGKAQDWLHHNYEAGHSVDALARRLGMSPRNFARRFKDATGQTPLGYLQRLRVEMARRHLEGSRKRVQEVSSAVGYDDVMFFRALFKRHTGLSPSQYRRRFGPP